MQNIVAVYHLTIHHNFIIIHQSFLSYLQFGIQHDDAKYCFDLWIYYTSQLSNIAPISIQLQFGIPANDVPFHGQRLLIVNDNYLKYEILNLSCHEAHTSQCKIGGFWHQ